VSLVTVTNDPAQAREAIAAIEGTPPPTPPPVPRQRTRRWLRREGGER
jgi:hypothetical protein